MDFSRISFGEMVAGAGGAALLLVMFLPWYGVETEFEGLGEVTRTAWEAFGFIDVLLFLVGAIAVGMVLARAAGAMPAGLPAPPGMIVAAAGALAVVLILFRLIAPPDPGFTGDALDFGRKAGILLGLLAAAAVAFGGYTATNERASGTAPPPR